MIRFYLAAVEANENILHRLNQNIFGHPNFAPAQEGTPIPR